MTFEEFFNELTGLTPTPEDIEASKAEGTYFEHLPLTMQDMQEIDIAASSPEWQKMIKQINQSSSAVWSRLKRNTGYFVFTLKHTDRFGAKWIQKKGLENGTIASLLTNKLEERFIKAAHRVPDRQTFCRKFNQELLRFAYFYSHYPIKEEIFDVTIFILFVRYQEVAWLKKFDSVGLSLLGFIGGLLTRDKKPTPNPYLPYRKEDFNPIPRLLHLFSKLSKNEADQDEQDGEMQEDVANLLDDLNMMREQGINAISIKQASIEYMIARGHIEIDNPEHKGNWKWWALIQVWAELAKAEGIHGMGYSYQDGGEVSPKGLNEEDREWINAEYGELYTDADSGVIKTRLARNKEWRKFYYDIEPPHDELVQLCEEIRKNAFFDTLS